MFVTNKLRGVAQWVERLTRNWSVVNLSPSKTSVVSLSQNIYTQYLALVGTRNSKSVI